MRFSTTLLAGLATLCCAAQVQATTYVVATKALLQTRMNAALPGDTVVVETGTYNWGQILFTNNNGNANSAWIVLTTRAVGAVTFTGDTRIHFKGTRVHVTGFRFANGNTGTSPVLSFRSNSSNLSQHSRISRCIIDNYNSDDLVENEWVAFYGTHNRLDHCSFFNKSNGKATVVVWYEDTNYPAPATSTYHRIDSNFFRGRSFMAANGGETIRLGDSESSRTNGFNVVAHNVFEQCRQAEPEIISNKSDFNTLCYNTFRNCNGGITLRHGRYSQVFGNFFLRNDATITEAYGVRIIDRGHQVFNNYFEGLNGNAGGGSSQNRAVISLLNGSTRDTTNAGAANGYFPADSCWVVFNTIVNTEGGGAINLGGTLGGSLLPQGVVLANNLIKTNSGTAVYRVSNSSALTYAAEGNLYQSPGGLGLTNTNGFSSVALAFGARQANGLLAPPQNAQDAAVSGNSYAALLSGMDALGRSRSGLLDVGGQELNGSGPTVYTPLDSTVVGAFGSNGFLLSSTTARLSGRWQGAEARLHYVATGMDEWAQAQVEWLATNGFERVAAIDLDRTEGIAVHQPNQAVPSVYRIAFQLKTGQWQYSNLLRLNGSAEASWQLRQTPGAKIIQVLKPAGSEASRLIILNGAGQYVLEKSLPESTTLALDHLAAGSYHALVLLPDQSSQSIPFCLP